MCISRAASRKQRAVTFVEIFVVLVIVAIIVIIGLIGWSNALERRREETARGILRAIWQGEQSYYAWHFIYTDDWSQLDVPSVAMDKYYSYELNPGDTGCLVKATRDNSAKGFCIDSEGEVTAFTGPH